MQLIPGRWVAGAAPARAGRLLSGAEGGTSVAGMAVGRFVADSSLDWFARRLRILGYDVLVLQRSRLEQVCELARAEGRIVLTLSRRVPAAGTFVARVVVARADPAASLRELASRYEPDAAAFSRCTACNHPLAPPGEAASPPEGAPRDARAVRRCPACGKWYWHGSHVDRLRVWFERALGHPLPAPE